MAACLDKNRCGGLSAGIIKAVDTCLGGDGCSGGGWCVRKWLGLVFNGGCFTNT